MPGTLLGPVRERDICRLKVEKDYLGWGQPLGVENDKWFRPLLLSTKEIQG